MIILRLMKIITCFGILITNSKLILSKDITQNELPFKLNCDNEYNVMCLKLDIVKFIEKLSEKSEYNLYPGISLLHETNPSDEKNSEIVAEIAKNYPNDTEKRLDSYLLSKLANYVHSLSLRLKLVDPNGVDYPKSMGTARRGKIGKSGGLQAIMAAAMMMKGTLMTITMGGLALLAGKALLTSLMALMLSAIVGIKSLTSGGGKHTTYEIVAKPIVQTSHSHSVSHEELHGGGGGGHMSGAYGYRRSIDLNLPKHLSQPN